MPANGRVHEKEREKVEKYQGLRREMGRLWQLKNVQAIPVIGALGSVTKDIDNWMENWRYRVMLELYRLPCYEQLGSRDGY